MSFYVGQKVICVDDSPRLHEVVEVRKGSSYTVKNIVFGGYGVVLNEVYAAHAFEGSFWSDRFRPIDPLTEVMDRIESELEPEFA